MTDDQETLADWLPGKWFADQPRRRHPGHAANRRWPLYAVIFTTFAVLMVGGVRFGLWAGGVIVSHMQGPDPVLVIPGPAASSHSASPAARHHHHHHRLQPRFHVNPAQPAVAPAPAISSPAAVVIPRRHHPSPFRTSAPPTPAPSPTFSPTPAPTPSPSPSSPSPIESPA